MRIIFSYLCLLTIQFITYSTVYAARYSDNFPNFECLIEPELVIEISSPVEGIIKSISVDKSDWVKKDQQLVQLESGVHSAIAAVAKERANMKDEIATMKTNLEFAKRNYSRMKKLLKKKSISPQKIDEAKTAVTLARLELKKAEHKQKLAKLEHEQALSALDLRTLRSPIAGVVVDRYASVGEAVSDKPVLKLAKVDPLRIELIVPVQYFGTITTGMQAKITTEIDKLGSYNATVSVVDQVIDAPSGTFSVRLTLPNPDSELAGGLKCKAQF